MRPKWYVKRKVFGRKKNNSVTAYKVKPRKLLSGVFIIHNKTYFACSRASVTVVMSHTSVGP